MSKFNEELTIIIPAFNEEKSIEETILECKKYCPESVILVIDDCSKDKTAKIVNNLKERVKKLEIISHQNNKGYGAALITGFSKSKTRYVAFIDADLTYPAKYIPSLLKMIKDNDLDCAWGNRFGKD